MRFIRDDDGFLEPKYQPKLRGDVRYVCFSHNNPLEFPITTTGEVWSNGALDPWSGMGVYPKNSKGPEGPMVQEINEETRYVVNNGNRTKSGVTLWECCQCGIVWDLKCWCLQ